MRNQKWVPFGPKTRISLISLFCGQPVAEPYAKLLNAFDTPDSSRKFWAQQPCIRGFLLERRGRDNSL